MIEHLSYSSISSYLYCSAAWKFKYLEKAPTYSTPELAFGSAFHNTVEAHLSGKGDLLQCWGAEWAKTSKDESRGKILWGASTPEQSFNDGVRMLSNPDVKALISRIKPGRDDRGLMIERKVELRVPGVPIPIIGYIDVITNDGIPGDFKTSSKSWNQQKAQSETQSLFYLAALNQAGFTVPEWKFRHFVFVKTKTPKAEMFEHKHNPGQVFWLFEMIQHVWAGIVAGIFHENPTSWLCSPGKCDFWKLCRGKYE